MTRPTLLIRVEAAMAAVGLVLVLAALGPPWWLWVVVLAAPDLSLLAYRAGTRVGAIVYNAAHFAALPLAGLAGLFLVAGLDADATLVEIAMLWLLHITIDRALGFGLKLPSGFRDTHLGRIGRAA